MRTSLATFTAARIAMFASFLVGGYFLTFDAGDYLRSITADVYGRYWPMRHWLFLHIVTGSLALIAGAIQLCLAFLRRTTTLHRVMGRVYVATVFVSCVASLMVLQDGSVIGPAWVALLVILASCALLFTACGLLEARRRRWQRHAAWMIRSYMAMMVFAWFRLAWELPLLTNTPTGTRAAAILGLTMLITLAGTEVALRRLGFIGQGRVWQ
ncbi:MAG TPA: DUF2306 domain-containing protein [Steroidobacter sp.]|uniref:DUF2306 domain-containing protein n=1 Tax=Steroidobacter sp. TaxID=1978227 RepID=UPI002ED9F62D